MNKRTPAWVRHGSPLYQLTAFLYISLFLHRVAGSPITVHESHLSYWII